MQINRKCCKKVFVFIDIIFIQSTEKSKTNYMTVQIVGMKMWLVLAYLRHYIHDLDGNIVLLLFT